MKFLKTLFGSGKTGPKEEESIEYNNFNIQPCPQNGGNGWTTEAMISRVVDGETLSHHFIRADSSPGRDAAVSLTVSKAKNMIDQSADRLLQSLRKPRGSNHV